MKSVIEIFLGLWENIKGQEKECVFFKMLDYLLLLLKEVETPAGEGRGERIGATDFCEPGLADSSKKWIHSCQGPLVGYI